MRNMSFFLTTAQVLDGSKTVTRRLGWHRLRAGDYVQAVRSAQGIRKGDKMQRLRVIRVLDVRREPLNWITREDVIAEGFPQLSLSEFVEMFCRTHKGCLPETMVTRIAFEYPPTEESP